MNTGAGGPLGAEHISVGPVFRGPAWVDGAWRAAECRELPNGYDLAVAHGGRLWIDSAGAVFQEAPSARDVGRAVAEGPALLLSLALRGVFCLHASAVVHGDGVIAFGGPSGVGKSTLAGLLGREGWPRWADDIVPARIGRDHGAMATRDLPQPMATASRPGGFAASADGGLPLRAVCVIDQAEAALVTLQRKHGVAATALLIRHTVAACLFGPRLLADHLAFCVDLARTVPVFLLSFPRRLDIAPRLARVLADV